LRLGYLSQGVVRYVAVGFTHDYYDIAVAEEGIDYVDVVPVEKFCDVRCYSRSVPGIRGQVQ